jgi:hypothetical protein
MDYITGTSIGILDEASETIDEAKEKHADVEIQGGPEDQSREVESARTAQQATDLTLAPRGGHDNDEKESDESVAYTRSRAFEPLQGQVQLEPTETMKQQEATKQRLREIEMVNESLKSQGDYRRYVATESDAPADAHIHEDAFGKYYYKGLGVEVRPSDVAEYAGEGYIGELSETEKAEATVALMCEMYGSPVLDANTMKAASSWLERHMVMLDDDAGSNDTFEYEFKDKIASAISNVNVKSVEKECDYCGGDHDEDECPEEKEQKRY